MAEKTMKIIFGLGGGGGGITGGQILHMPPMVE
jgi:hypothetical protein